jgi:hypothetical protein
MSTQYRLVQSGKTASGGCSAGQGSSEPVAPRIYLFILFIFLVVFFSEQMFPYVHWTDRRVDLRISLDPVAEGKLCFCQESNSSL